MMGLHEWWLRFAMPLLLVLGVGLLMAGGNLLVNGASRLAMKMGVSRLVIGLTIVALGTSSPELAVSLKSTLDGKADIALGNVVGSNILNVLLILGISALIRPLVVTRRLVWHETPLMVFSSIMVLAFGLDGKLSSLEGVILIVGLAIYVTWTLYQSRREHGGTPGLHSDTGNHYHERAKSSMIFDLLFIVGGLAVLVVGARCVVAAAVDLAREAGINELVIGLTIVAVGTSLPEVATSIVAARRGENDIAVANVIGSNIFNLLGVLGITAIVASNGLPVSVAALHFDIPVMIGTAVACLPIFFTGHLIARWEGALFLAYYLAYTGYLIMNASAHAALPAYSWVMLFIVLPLTVVTLVVVTVRSIKRS